MSNTIRMQLPAGVSQIAGSQGVPGGSGQTYTPDGQGFVTVDPRDVQALLTAGATFAVPGTNAAFGVSPRNLFDAADFTVNPWQKGTAAVTTGTTAIITADRWIAISGTSLVANVSRAANTQVAGFTQSLQFGRSTGDTHSTGISVGQVLETADCYRVQGLTLALSFWANCGATFAAGTSAGQVAAVVYSGTGTDDTFANMVTGGWTGSTQLVSTNVSLTTAATRYGPFYATVPAAATQLGVAFSYLPSAGTTAGATENIQLMGAQLEVGSMTNFEHLDVAYVLEQCQRYLIVLNEGTAGTIQGTGGAGSTTTALIYIGLPAPMRKAPTVTLTTGGFAVTNGAGTAVAVSTWGSAATLHTPQAIGLLATVASGLTAGQFSSLVGRTTGSGNIEISADYATN